MPVPNNMFISASPLGVLIHNRGLTVPGYSEYISALGVHLRRSFTFSLGVHIRSRGTPRMPVTRVTRSTSPQACTVLRSEYTSAWDICTPGATLGVLSVGQNKRVPLITQDTFLLRIHSCEAAQRPDLEKENQMTNLRHAGYPASGRLPQYRE